MRRIVALGTTTLLALGLLATPASATGSSPAPTGNVVETAVAASGGGTPDENPFDYDILVQAVLAADLAPTLSDASTEFTVFAPNDLAFRRLAHDLSGTYPRTDQAALDTILGALTELGNGDPIPVLREVLLYHVVPGATIDPVGFLKADSVTVANGATIELVGPYLRDADPDLRNPRLTLPLDVNATNGVIHTINRVLIPLDI